MLLVILGAGASFDSVNTRTTSIDMTFKPPLAKDLFDTRNIFSNVIDSYPQVRTLASRLRRATAQNKDFEQTLEAIQKEYSTDPTIEQQLGALRFYLRDIIRISTNNWFSSAHGVTNYQELTEKLENWRRINSEEIVYVTFNYDDLLEKALSQTHRRSFLKMEDYVSDRRTMLIKPHGSVTWAELAQLSSIANFNNTPGYVIDRFEKLKLSNQIMYVGDSSSTYDGEVFMVPAIAVPLHRKTNFVSPQDHLAKLFSAMGKADRILTIGWRGNEQHFKKSWLDNLLKSPALYKVLVASGTRENAKITIQNMEKIWQGAAIESTEGGFSELFDTPELEKFLS